MLADPTPWRLCVLLDPFPVRILERPQETGTPLDVRAMNASNVSFHCGNKVSSTYIM
jgi:hypothetical protein